MESNFAFCGVRTHAYYRIVDLKSTPLDLSGKNAAYFAVFFDKLYWKIYPNFNIIIVFVAVRKHFAPSRARTVDLWLIRPML